MSCALAIWVKTPGLSPIKTRLAAGIGAERAFAVYAACVAATAAVAGRAQRIERDLEPCWAVAEAAALDAPPWQGMPRIAQGPGGLGERLARVYDRLLSRHAAVLFIGADAPQLQPAALVSACRALRDGEADFLLGRAADGGFWLFGGRLPLPPRLWTEVRYSAADTAANLAAGIQAHGRLAWVPPLRDLDRVEDLHEVIAALRALPAPLREQRRLLVLLERLQAT